jgi:ATP-dependent Lhr-like helicase
MHGLDPLVADWFARRFPAPTEPQRDGWPLIREGHDVLISAPTGSGKTLAAFLIAIDDLVRRAREGALEDRVHTVYVSPLKALSNDIQKNLQAPLAEISPPVEIRAALRTGDTPAWEREQMARRPPHILVTTPESLYILLTAGRSRQALATARTVIVDEIHAVAGSKRGSHLALSLARLDALVESSGLRRPQRVGLSATVSPIDEIARLLGDDVRIVEAGRRRAMDLAVEVPRDELGPIASNEMWAEIYDRIAALILEHRTTLVFVNTRRLAEKVAHHLTERLGENAVLPHHGSLSRKLRLNAEERLKSGELRAVVATASLELGIDIGTVDLVCQVGSPRSLSVALQRIGRSGHWVGANPKGRLFPSTRDELIECAALVAGLREGKLDRIPIPRAPLDILAQQIVAAAACGDYAEDDLFALVRRAFPYRDLPRADFDAVVEMLSEGIATARGRGGAYLHRDRVNSRVRGRRGARLAAITSGGAIPDNAQYLVVAEPEGATVGTLDEDFAIESMAGDVFLLGTTSWRIRRVEQGRVRVEDAHGAAPSIPFWNGEAPGRTAELSAEVSDLRERILERGDPVAYLIAECGLDRRGAEQAVDYVRAGRAALPALPTQRTVIAERFFDEAGGMQLVIHAPFGARVNRAWGLALRKRFCRSFNLELQAAATDNGIVISLTEQHAFPLETVFEFVRTSTLDHTLTQALLAAPMFTARWRWNCSRALAILRFAGGRKVPPPIQRMRADDLMAAVFPDQAACAENLTGEIRIPDHPLVRETIGDCLHEAMDLDALRRIVAGIESGEIRTLAADTGGPSVFCHEILNANPFAYLDDAPLEERRARAVQLRSTMPADFSETMGALDEAAIRQVAEESWPLVRDADELHDALLTLVLAPPGQEWREHFAVLEAARRATTLNDYWVAAERLDLARSLPSEEALAATIGGWLESTGPTTVAALAERLALSKENVAVGLAVLESRGLVLSGRYTPGLAEGEIEWCNRRVLARIHRLTLGRLRREIEPVTTVEFLLFLARWQHVAPSTRLHGVDGLLEVIRQLQGYEIPAAAWESQVLARRVENYEPDLLDQLCLAGEVVWGRVSPHPAFEEPPNGNGHRRVRPTRVAPIALFLREDFGELPALEAREPALSHQAREVLAALRERGASFFNELKHATRRLASEIEEALWELVTAGLVTADGFENLRTLLDTRRRAPRPRHAAGRWSLLRRNGAASADAARSARLLLRRWGVVCRDLLARESLAPAWRDLLVELRRMEARGEIRGGRFVASLAGEQYALPEAVDLLRRVRREKEAAGAVHISAADPLNLRGIVLPGPRVSVLEWDSVQPLV